MLRRISCLYLLALLIGCESKDAQPTEDGGQADASTPPPVSADAGPDASIMPTEDAGTPVEPVASSCADIAVLSASDQLMPHVVYSNGERTFAFELTDESSSGSALATECAALATRLEALVEAGAPGARLDYRSPAMHLQISVGESNTETKEAMTIDGLFRIASVGKSYLGTLAAVLALDGTLDLDNSDGEHALLDYLPEIADQIEYADSITLRQLLDHTSGVPDYYGEMYGPAWLARIFEARDAQVPVTEDEALAIVLGKPADFAPGTSAAYSNTGYILVGKVITSVLGHSWQKELHDRLLSPLGLTDTYAEKVDSFDLSRLSHGYRDASELGQDFSDWFAVDQGYGFANGAIVASAAETAAFFRAVPAGLVDVKGVDDAELGKLLRPAADGYSMGVVAANGCYGHGGSFTGYNSIVFACPETQRSWVVMLNSTRPEDDEGMYAWSDDLTMTRGVPEI